MRFMSARVVTFSFVRTRSFVRSFVRSLVVRLDGFVRSFRHCSRKNAALDDMHVRTAACANDPRIVS